MQDDVDNDAIDFSYYWKVVKGRWKLIGAFVAVVTSVAIVWSFSLPKLYKASATIMPVGSGGGGFASLAGQLGGLGALMGVGIGGGGVSPGQKLMVLLNSRSLAEQIIKKDNLFPVFFPTVPDQVELINKQTVGFLQGHMKFSEDKKGGGVIMVSAQFEDPKLAAKVVNVYIDGLQEFINESSLTASKRNRVFIGKRLEENKRDLLEAGKELSDFYNGGKVSSVGSYVDVPSTRSKKSDSESGIKEKLKIELELLQNQKMALESAPQQPSSGGGVFSTSTGGEDKGLVKNVPQQVYLQYLSLRRDLLVQVNSLLTQQYEMAKIDEMKDDLAFQIIDPAIVPASPADPQRKKIVMFAFVMSFFFSVFVVLLLDHNKTKLKNNL